VVETTNLTDKTAFGVNGNGTQHSKLMKITERFRRVAPDVIQYQATWDDPGTYTAPFTVSFPLTPLDGGELLPYDCHAGNMAIFQSLGAERAEDKALAADLAKGHQSRARGSTGMRRRRRRSSGGRLHARRAAAAGGRGGRGGRGGAANTGEDTIER
jgi:hypothetical protein